MAVFPNKEAGAGTIDGAVFFGRREEGNPGNLTIFSV